MRYEQYMNFLSYINISNNLKINSDELEQPYVLYVGKGNNGSLIKSSHSLKIKLLICFGLS